MFIRGAFWTPNAWNMCCVLQGYGDDSSKLHLMSNLFAVFVCVLALMLFAHMWSESVFRWLVWCLGVCVVLCCEINKLE
jgi:hypothetical protein